MKFEVIDLVDNDDGSSTLTIDMSQEALRKFASIGVLKVITDAAKEVVDNIDNIIKDVDEYKNEHIDLDVARYIDDAIRILERRPQLHVDQASTIDALLENCYDAINILTVARGLVDDKDVDEE